MSLEQTMENLQRPEREFAKAIFAAVEAQELRYFEKIRSELEKNHPGGFVLIMGEELIGIFENYEIAFQEGMRRFQSHIFLVKSIK